MGTKLPSTDLTSNYASDTHAIIGWHLEKDAWQRDRAMQGNHTLDILRYTESGGSAYAGIEPSFTPVSNLTGLKVYTDENPKEMAKRYNVVLEEGILGFILYDVIGAVQRLDRIEYLDDLYSVEAIDFEPQSGRTEILAKLIRSEI